MTKRIIILIFGLLTFSNSFSQNAPDNWEKNYPSIKLADLLNYEKSYADSIEKNKNTPPYYSRTSKCKFKGKYLGETRRLENEIKQSMSNVWKLHIGEETQLNKMVENEYLFEIDGQNIWMPIQKILENDFKIELKKESVATLYCLHFNEHKFDNKMFNIFLISEFAKE